MKTIIHIGAFGMAILLLTWIPAGGFNGFNLKGKLDKIGMPDPILDQLGSLMYKNKLKKCNPSEIEEDIGLVNSVWVKLVNAAPQSAPYKDAKAKSWKWEVTLIEALDNSDAEAFPGGKVLVYSGCCAVAKKKPAQMAFLLGHEMAHALARHAKTRIDKHTQTAITAAATGGTLNASKLDPEVTIAAMSAMGVAYEGAVVKPFAREQEFEADRHALALMAQAGYDPQASIEYLKNLEANSSSVKHSSLDDHPSVKERMANLKRHLSASMEIYRKIMG